MRHLRHQARMTGSAARLRHVLAAWIASWAAVPGPRGAETMASCLRMRIVTTAGDTSRNEARIAMT